MATLSSTSMKSRSAAPRKRLVFLLVILVLLSGVAVYVRTLPARREKALRAATLPQLIALSKQEPNNPRVFYHLGLRLQSVGQLPPARAAFERAADLDGDDEDAWLAWATVAGNLGNEQEAFGVLSAYVQAHPKSARAHLAWATFYYAQEALPRAYEEALAATKLDPKDGAAWRLAGISALGLEKYVEAEDAFRQAVKLAPTDWRALIGLGDALDRQERKKEALDWYRKASEAAPNEPVATLAVGRTQFKTAATPAEIAAARQTLERAAQQDPNNGQPLLWLGRAYVREGNWKQAQQVQERAARLSPDAFEVAYELQRIYTHLGDKARAAEQAKRHQQLHAYALDTYNILARLHEAKGDLDRQLRLELSRKYAAHGDYAKAAREYRQLIRRAPDLAVARRELAEVERKLPQTAKALPLAMPGAAANVSLTTLLQDGEAMLAQKRYAEAQNAFMTALQRDPNQARAAEGLGLALAGQGKNDEAFKVLTRVLEVEPTRPKAQYTVAQLYYDIGLPDEATHRMEKLVKQVPNNAEYVHGLGMCYLSTEQPQKAAERLSRAATLSPENAGYWSDLATAELKNEKPELAETHYRQAARLAPNDPDTLVALGKFLLDRQATPARLQEAEQLFQKALSVRPEHEDALLAMGRLQVLRKKPQQAVTPLETLINRNPDQTQAYYQLAKAYDQLGNKARADYCRKLFRVISEFHTERDNTEEQVRMHRKDPALRLKLARLYARGGQNAKAINQFQMCLYLDPKNAAARRELEALEAHLKATGQMESVTAFNNMVSAALSRK
ncbi:MAG TPA: tetratricopeptide repeat protein [Chthonomonadaceae bacterium]|nr:tetratricopeptide repeat protein [Chthonomonadaceae bacterium]